jgi:formylglycine-generating enzyme required for sulfatase activity
MERTQLAQLVARLKDLDRPGGRMDRVRAARQQIVRFAEWSLNPSEWKTAIDSIANRTECPAYDGLVIDPQFGLIPLGRDSRSGFWEFLHVQSGGPPCVYSNGEFEPHADMGIIFVLLPGGAAAMGGQRLDSTQLLYDDQAQADQSPPTAYNLDPFFLSKYEMTQGQWLRMGGRDSSLYPAGEDPDARLDRPSLESIYPAESMTKAEASSLVQRFGLVLPTEAQWEYACRGGSLTKWWWGETFVANPSYVNLADFTYKARKGPEVASDAIDGFARIAPVGCLPPNPFGLYEISGNVCEWCSDPYWYHAYEFPIIDGAGHRDVSGSKAGPELPSVARGGAFQCTYEKTRSAHRYGNADAYAHVGLRPARALILQP